MIILFPQSQPDTNSYSTPASGVVSNPGGCWDVVGIYGPNFAQKSGAQTSAIKAMVDRLASGSR
jgi:hypothetical protein